MDKLYFDWSIRRGVKAGKNGSVTYYRDLDELLDATPVSTRLVGEATFSSFDIDQRRRVIERCEREGRELLTTPNRLTGRHRRAMGYTDADKSDELDISVLQHIDESGVHLKRPSLADESFVMRREAANAEMMNLRRTGEMRPRPRAGGYVRASAKDAYAESLIPLLPPYQELVGSFQKALGDGKQYSLVVLAAAGIAAKYARNREEFERLCGLYGHGYPSQIRADLHHYAWAGGNRRPRLDGTKADGIRKRKDGLKWREYRRALRWLYAQFKASGMTDPETGTRAPLAVPVG